MAKSRSIKRLVRRVRSPSGGNGVFWPLRRSLLGQSPDAGVGGGSSDVRVSTPPASPGGIIIWGNPHPPGRRGYLMSAGFLKFGRFPMGRL